MAESEVAICNLALDKLGVDPITSLDDAVKAARLAKRNFAPMRDAVLRAYPWNCATRRASLAASAAAPSWGFERAFNLPEGGSGGAALYCLRVLAIEEQAELDKRFKIEGRQILTDEAAPLNILYIGRITDVRQFDALLDECIAARLAAELAYALTGSKTLARELFDGYRGKLPEARTIDAQEGTPDSFLASEWLESRY